MPRAVLALLLLLGPGAVHAQDRSARARPTKPRGASLGQWQATGSKGVVVAGGAEAVDAGLAMLRAGGNAADAAVTTLLTQTVTDANQYCFGGEVPILAYDARRGVVEVLAGQGVAPRLATVEYFRKKGGIPRQGVEAATVPATLDACVTLLDRHGTRTFATVVAPTLAILDRHEQPWHANLARTLRRLVAAEQAAGGDRNRGLRRVADAFYRGAIAREIDAWSRAHGGLLRYSDLATHVTRVEEPVTLSYRGYRVLKCGPWTQGPYLLQTLQLLEGFELKPLGPGRADTIHLAVEALKLGLADRDTYYADPLFEEVPLPALLAPKYAALRRALIDPRAASLVHRPGDPRAGKALAAPAAPRSGGAGEANDTTTCLVADGQGNVIAATPSGWSGALAGDTGVWLGSRLQSLNLWEGHPNCLVPGKRPRITLTPTLVFQDDQPVLAVSVAGGDGQDQVALQMLLNVLDFGMRPAEAVTAPRFATNHLISSFGQVPPELGSLRINPGVGAETLAELKRRGHRLTVHEGVIWHPTVVTIDRARQELRAAGDPKAGRHAAGF